LASEADAEDPDADERDGAVQSRTSIAAIGTASHFPCLLMLIPTSDYGEYLVSSQRQTAGARRACPSVPLPMPRVA
jgi:hypothetical protein